MVPWDAVVRSSACLQKGLGPGKRGTRHLWKLSRFGRLPKVGSSPRPVLWAERANDFETVVVRIY